MKMDSPKKKIVIYGGAFNPPHIGHTIAIENILRFFPCDEVWVVPSADRHDKQISVSGDDRLKMFNIMIDEIFPDSKVPILISDVELKRGIMTTTLDTKLELEKKHPEHQFFFQMGSDVIGDIKSGWLKGRELFETANFIVTKRLGSSLPKELPKNSVILGDKQVISIDISSTLIRRLLARGYSGMPYITKGVAEYIKENKLYK
jgi:nicotinate-nucleotide adenylyltransferase